MILGLDPGRDKIGWAFVSTERELLLSGILPAQERALFWDALARPGAETHSLFQSLSRWTREAPFSPDGPFFLRAVVIGGGTCSGGLVKELEKRDFGCPILCVDERGTTLGARNLYWQLHKPSWWQRFLPQALRVPPRPLDDLAAWGIAVRGIDQWNQMSA